MLSDGTALKMTGISKRFEMYSQPFDRLKQMMFGRFGKRYFNEFWALKDINLEVKCGECIGIIGKNGAGKSTLLQILVGTLPPTEGRVEVKGRICALLELGSGFNPEYTGRENVYMNASILGFSREEINQKYDEIVSFADIGEFIDQPVKTYSSGMVVRLAFSVQVALAPDILIVDEALAVGDAAFSRKCIARMEQLITRGCTIILVTHDINAVKRFCKKCLFLREGKNAYFGDTEEAATRYYQYLFPNFDPMEETTSAEQQTPSEEVEKFCLEIDCRKNNHRWGNGGGSISRLVLHGISQDRRISVPHTLKIDVHAQWDKNFILQLCSQKDLPSNIVIGYLLTNSQNIPIYGTNTLLERKYINAAEVNRILVSFEVELPALQTGDYFLTFAVSLANSPGDYFDLEWNDMSVQFFIENNNMLFKPGITLLPTCIHIKKD